MSSMWKRPVPQVLRRGVSATVRILLAVLLVAGCSVRQELVMEPDRSGVMKVHIEMHPMVADYVFEVAEVVYGMPIPEDERRLFDVPELRAAVDDFSTVELVSADVPAFNTLEFVLRFGSLDAVVTELRQAAQAPQKNESIFPVTVESRLRGAWNLRLYLTAGNFRPLLRLTPFSGHPMVETFGPQPANPYSPDEYIDMLDYVLEDFAAGEDLGAIMENSTFTLVFRSPGKITAGGSVPVTAVDGGITLALPVLDLLTLYEPVELDIGVTP